MSGGTRVQRRAPPHPLRPPGDRYGAGPSQARLRTEELEITQYDAPAFNTTLFTNKAFHSKSLN